MQCWTRYDGCHCHATHTKDNTHKEHVTHCTHAHVDQRNTPQHELCCVSAAHDRRQGHQQRTYVNNTRECCKHTASNRTPTPQHSTRCCTAHHCRPYIVLQLQPKAAGPSRHAIRPQQRAQQHRRRAACIAESQALTRHCTRTAAHKE